MADFVFETTPQRSQLMKRIKSKNTKPELKLRKHLYALGFRYRLNVVSLPGKPDIVISKYKIAIFVDGEFWHGYNWENKKKKIQANKDYWINKIEKNIARDKETNLLLSEYGFKVFRFWEKDIKKDIDACSQLITSYVGQVGA